MVRESSRLTSSSIGSIQDEYTYNSYGEPLSYSSGGLFSQTFVRDSLGRITQKTDSKAAISTTWNYLYDSSGRLSEVHKDGALFSRYTFDMNGNRLEKLSPQGSVLASFDEQDRILTSGSLSFSYNNNGDLVSYSDSSQSPTQFYSFDYDVFGNLRGVLLPNGDQIEYMIDGQNRRVGKKLNGSLVQGFIYQDQLNPIAELDGSGSVKSIFVYGSKAHVPDYMIQGPKKYKIISDHLGSVRMVIDLTDNSVAQEIDYDEYGVVLADSNPGFQPFGFAGGITDQHTNLVRFGARDYMAEVGRWTLMDSSLFTDGLGLYHYVSQDPINYIDISGYNKRFPGPNLTNAGGTIGIGGGRGGGYTVTPRTTRGGGRGVRVNFNDGRVVDITKDRVKEYRPNPNTRSGKERVIFDEGTPRTERWPNDPKKRPPTPEELDFLNRQCPVASGENE